VFYAGVKLIDPDGYTLGTLSVMNVVARSLGDQQLIFTNIGKADHEPSLVKKS
jgi:hypothetical protein